jgi:hypothetical protein
MATGYTFGEDTLEKALYQLQTEQTVFYSVPEQTRKYIGEKGDALYHKRDM